jgi:HAMP domain-containing protein
MSVYSVNSILKNHELRLKNLEALVDKLDNSNNEMEIPKANINLDEVNNLKNLFDIFHKEYVSFKESMNKNIVIINIVIIKILMNKHNILNKKIMNLNL